MTGRQPNRARRQHAPSACRPERASTIEWDDDIPPHLWWVVRYKVAMRTAFYLTVRISAEHLRARVVEHIAVNWWRSCCHGGHPDGLDGVYRDYCRDVEQDIDPKATDKTWEVHRVWTNHAAVLGGEIEAVEPRP